MNRVVHWNPYSTRDKPSDLYPKLVDPTPVSVGSRSQSPETKTDGLVDGSTLQNSIPTDLTAYILKTLIGFHRYEGFPIISRQIRWDPARSLQDLVSNFRNLNRFGHVSARSSRFWPVLAWFWPFLAHFGIFRLPWFWLTTDRHQLISESPKLTHLMVGDGSRCWRLDVVETVPGWAQTRPRLVDSLVNAKELLYLAGLKHLPFGLLLLVPHQKS